MPDNTQTNHAGGDVYKITATLFKPGNTAVTWTHYSGTRMTLEQCEKRFNTSLKGRLSDRAQTRVENFCCEKKNEIMHNVVSIFFATLLSLSAAAPATATQMQEKQSGGHSCHMGYIATDTGDFSQSPVKTCLTENPGVISVSAGARFSVHFPDNPTTGMTWGLMRMPPSVMLISAEHSSQASCHTGMTGCRGEFTSTFRAIHHGTGNMVFTHSRLWENTYPSVKTLRINVQ